MTAIRIDLDPLLRPWAAQLVTRAIVIEQRAVLRAAAILRAHLPDGPWLLIADDDTWRVAGESVRAELCRARIEPAVHRVAAAARHAGPVADDEQIEALTERLRRGRFVAALAVGSGTVNDIVKLAATHAGIPYAVVATAPSMNGYTSSLAAPLSRGIKTTVPCRPPVVCLVDIDVLAAAPYRMIVAGLGDLVSKPVSNADWRLAHWVVDAPYAPQVMALIDAGAELLAGVAARLPERDPEAVGQLAASLCISGLAMGLAGSSAPASGAEHLISHYLDMTHFADGEPHDLHGCQVGVATLTMAAMYESMARWSPARLDVEARLAAHPGWDEYAAQVRQRFGRLADTVLEHARASHPTRPELERRLVLIKDHWREICDHVAPTLQPAAELANELRQAHGPVTYGAIGVTAARARRAVRSGKDIRARYTLLHLAADVGMLAPWSEAALTQVDHC